MDQCIVCHNPANQRCSACKSVQYCSAECQRADWNEHKKLCSGKRPTTVRHVDRQKVIVHDQTIYEWQQGSDDVNIFIQPPIGVTAKMLDVKITETRVTVGITNNPPYLNGDLVGLINVKPSYWTLENGELHVCLQKAQPGTMWDGALKGVNIETQQEQQRQVRKSLLATYPVNLGSDEQPGSNSNYVSSSSPEPSPLYEREEKDGEMIELVSRRSEMFEGGTSMPTLSPITPKESERFILPSSFEMLTTTPLQVIFKDLDFRVQVEKPTENGRRRKLFEKAETFEKRIISGINGVFTPGRLTAVMGASGSGKTSLLNLVAGQASAKNAIMNGEIVINGQALELKDKRLKKICGYVQQDDVILATMTVREAITMAALLRLPRTMTHEAKLSRVQQVIDLLHLQKCSENVIGSTLIKGISGGERKRVAIAMVMITNPSILLLDEPTSGLDAFTAYSICNTLKNVARTGRTVAATVHQPSSDIFHLFDDLVLLSEGYIIYHGPAEAMVHYFAKIGYQCPQYTNPADYLFMSILNDAKKIAEEGDKKGPTSEEQVARLAQLADNWLQSNEQSKVIDVLKTPVQGGFKLSDVIERATFQMQFYLLSQRAFKNAWRNKLMLKGRFGQTLFLSILIGLIYLQLGANQQGIQNREGSLFFVAVNGIMTSTMGVLSIFAAEKIVFIREFESGLYRLPAYFFSRTFVELPFKIVFPILGGTIIYWLIGFQAVGSKYVIMVVTMVILENCGTALGIFVASFFAEIAVALAVVPMLLMPLMIFSGFFVNSSTSPAFLQWIKYISPMKYAFVALIKNEFTGLEFHCPPAVNGTSPLGAPSCPYQHGEQIIDVLGFNDQGSIAVNLIVLAAMYIVLLILAYGALWRQLRLRK